MWEILGSIVSGLLGDAIKDVIKKEGPKVAESTKDYFLSKNPHQLHNLVEKNLKKGDIEKATKYFDKLANHAMNMKKKG